MDEYSLLVIVVAAFVGKLLDLMVFQSLKEESNIVANVPLLLFQKKDNLTSGVS